MGFVKDVVGGVLGFGGGSKAQEGYKPYDIAKRQGYNVETVAKNWLGVQGDDWSQAGKRPSMAQARGDVRAAYDFSPMDRAIKQLSSSPRMTQTYQSGYTVPQQAPSYQASQFNFTGLPSQYEQMAYGQGAKNIRREGAGSLQQVQEAMGTRRPGLLGLAAQGMARQQNERLADLGTSLGLERMRQETELGKAQQLSQAEENMRAYQSLINAMAQQEDARRFAAGEGLREYQSRAELEKGNIANQLAYAQALGGMGQARTQTESALAQQEEANRQAAMNYLMNLWSQAGGMVNQSAQSENQFNASKYGSNMGFLGSLLGR